MPLERAEGGHRHDARRSSTRPRACAPSSPGLPVLAAEANAAVSSDWRRLLTLVAGLLAVFVVLLVALRTRRRAVVPLVPIVLATGWSALVLFALRIPLNPMSVTLGALVIAISTEFSVLLSERYRQERAAGPRAGRRARPDVPLDGRRGAGLRRDGDRRLRGARRLRHPDAARLRLRDGGRSDGVAARRAADPAVGARSWPSAACACRGSPAPAAAGARRPARARPLDFGDEPPAARSCPEPPRRRRRARPAAAAARAARRARARYGWFLGVVGVLLVAVVTINGISTDSDVPSGGPDAGGSSRRSRCRSPTRASTATPTSRRSPGRTSSARGRRARCAGRRSSTSARSAEQGPVVLALFPTDAGRCRAVLDADASGCGRSSRAYASPRWAAEGDRDELRGGLGLPGRVGPRRAVAARYGLVGCPQVTFAQQGRQGGGDGAARDRATRRSRGR